MDSVSEVAQKTSLHVVFFPLLAHGHMIPLSDVARLFAERDGVKATIITTPGNAASLTKILNNTSLNIHLQTIPFPAEEAGIPTGFENFEYITTGDFDVLNKFLHAIRLLESPLEQALERLSPRPSCLVSDLFMPWTVDVAQRFGIPRLVFHGCGYFAMAVTDALRQHRLRLLRLLRYSEEDEEFVVPGLPGEVVKLTMRQMSSHWKQDAEPEDEISKGMIEAEKRSFGVVMNSFDELESEYAEHYRKAMGRRRAWSVGPVSLCHRNIEDKVGRGKKADIDEHECLRWLDSKPPNSVVYISFGSFATMSAAQLHQIALALDALGQHFIWVVRRPDSDSEEEGWLPSGFEDRTRDRGLVIREWAPQVMILDHGATGGFVTHCGWNSVMEGVSAGVTMVTWPMFAEQFINEKLVTDVLKVGVSVGAKQYLDGMMEGASVGRDAVEEAVKRAMVGEEAKIIRRRAEKLKEMASKAVQEGGSSYKGLSDLLEDLRSFHATN